MTDWTQRRSGPQDRHRAPHRERSDEMSFLLTDLLPRRQSPPRAHRSHHNPAQAPVERVTGVRIVSGGTRTHPWWSTTNSGRAQPVYPDEEVTTRAPRERGPSGGYRTQHRARTRRTTGERQREEIPPSRYSPSPPDSSSYRPRTRFPSRPQYHAREHAYPAQDLSADFERLHLSTGRRQRLHEEPTASYGTRRPRHSEYGAEWAPRPRRDDAYDMYQRGHPFHAAADNPDPRRTTIYDEYRYRSEQSPPPEAYDPADSRSHDESFTSESTKVEEPHTPTHVRNAYTDGQSPPTADHKKASTRLQDDWMGSDSTKVEECQTSSHASVPHPATDRPSRDLPMSRQSDSFGRLPVPIYDDEWRRIPARVSFDERGLFLVQTPPVLSTLKHKNAVKLKNVDEDSVAAAMRDPEVCWTLSEKLTNAGREYYVEAFNKDGTNRDEVHITLSMNPQAYDNRWQWSLQQSRAITLKPTLEDLGDEWKVSFDLPLGIHVETLADKGQEILDSMERGPSHWQIQFDPSAKLSKLRFTGVGVGGGEDPATPISATWELWDDLDDHFDKLWDHYESRGWPESDDSQI